jgi:hypothetical protein
MLNRCTYIYIGKYSFPPKRGNRKIELSKDLVSQHLNCHGLRLLNQDPLQYDFHRSTNEYNPNRISPSGISVCFPTSIWGFSLLHTLIDACSFGLLNNYLRQATR